SDRVIEVVPHPKRGPITKINVGQQAAHIRVYVLVAEERLSAAKPFRDLRVEGRRVVHRRCVLVGMTDEKAFVQEFDAMPDVNNVAVDNGLAEPDVWPLREIANPIVVN